jgi:hypothetical protein
MTSSADASRARANREESALAWLRAEAAEASRLREVVARQRSALRDLVAARRSGASPRVHRLDRADDDDDASGDDDAAAAAAADDDDDDDDAFATPYSTPKASASASASASATPTPTRLDDDRRAIASLEALTSSLRRRLRDVSAAAVVSARVRAVDAARGLAAGPARARDDETEAETEATDRAWLLRRVETLEARLRCVLYKSFSPVVRFQHLIAWVPIN